MDLLHPSLAELLVEEEGGGWSGEQQNQQPLVVLEVVEVVELLGFSWEVLEKV